MFQINYVAHHKSYDWSKILDSYKVDCVVYNRDLPLTNVLVNDPHWKLAYEDKFAVIFTRIQ